MSKHLNIIEELELTLMNLKLAGADISSNIHNSYIFKYNSGILDYLSSLMDVSNKELKQYFSLCLFLHKIYGLYGETTCFFKFSVNGFRLIISKSNSKFEIVPKSHIIDLMFFYDESVSSDSFLCRLFNKCFNYSNSSDLDKCYLNLLNKHLSDLDLNSKDVINLQNQCSNEYIKNKLNKLDINHISLDDFIHRFPSKKITTGRDRIKSSILLEKETFIKYILEVYPKSLYIKIIQLISLIEFINRIDSDISLNKSLSFNVEYFSYSKYKKINLLIQFTISNITISFFDDGLFDIHFYDGEDHISTFEDLDEAYDSLLKYIFNKVSSNLKINLSDISFRDLDLYIMTKF